MKKTLVDKDQLDDSIKYIELPDTDGVMHKGYFACVDGVPTFVYEDEEETSTEEVEETTTAEVDETAEDETEETTVEDSE